MSPIGELYKTINTSPHLYEILVSCFYFPAQDRQPLLDEESRISLFYAGI
jgi:hypothetical protein